MGRGVGHRHPRIIIATSTVTHVRLTLHDDMHALCHGRAVDVGGITAIVALELLQRLVLLSQQRPRMKTRAYLLSVLHPVETVADTTVSQLYMVGGQKGGGAVVYVRGRGVGGGLARQVDVLWRKGCEGRRHLREHRRLRH